MYLQNVATYVVLTVHSTVIYSQYRCTPLYVATHQGHYDVVRTLMEANADKDFVNEVQSI